MTILPINPRLPLRAGVVSDEGDTNMRQVVAAPFIEFDLEPSATGLVSARAEPAAWLEKRGIDEGLVGELLVVAVELPSNAAEATPDGGDPVHFVGRHDGSAVHFEVSNHARSGESWQGELPPRRSVGEIEDGDSRSWTPL